MRYLSLFATLLACLLLAACGGSGGNDLVEDDDGSVADGGGTVVVRNAAPEPQDDEFSVFADSVNNRLSVLANDSDPDGDTIMIESVDTASQQGGALRIQTFGNANPLDDVIEYDPPAGFTGADSFQYVINDGDRSTTATVDILVVAVACLDKDAQIAAGLGYCISANLLTSHDGTSIDIQLFIPHPDDLNALGGFSPLLIHGHGFGGNKYDDFSFPEHFVDAQAALLAWQSGYFVASFTQRGFENSSGRIGIMSPDLEGRDFQELVDWLIKHIRGNTNGALPLNDPAGDSIYNFVFDSSNPDHTSTTIDATDSRPSLLRNDNGTVLLGGEQAQCDPVSFPTIDPDCDPALGTLGYSYGGGFQYTASHADNTGRYGGERVDAIAPEGTWFDLRYSLHANDVPKTVWIELLTTFALQGGNGEQLPDALVQGQAESKALNRVSAGVLNDSFKPNGPVFYCDPITGTTTLTADVFHMQGFRDTLFNFNEGYDNALCFERAGADVRLLQLTNGHPLPLISEVNYTGRSTSMDIDEVVHCGVDGSGEPQRLIVKDLIFAWYEEKLRGQAGAADIIPNVCIVQLNTDPTDTLMDPNYTDDNNGGNPGSAFKYPKEGVVYNSVTDILVGASDLNASAPQYVCDSPVGIGTPHICEVPATTVNFGPDPVTGNTVAFVPVFTVPAGESRVMAGIPTAQLNVDTISPDPLLFMGTAILRAGETSAELIHDQLTPIRNGDSDFLSPGTIDFPWTDANGNTNKDGGPFHYGCPPNENTLCDRGRLTGISVRMNEGDQVGLIFYGHSLQYFENSSRTPGMATVSGNVEMPIMSPSALPVSVNP